MAFETTTEIPVTTYTIPLLQIRPSIWTGTLPNELDLDQARVVLAVQASIPVSDLTQRMPFVLKVSSATHLEKLVKRALPGIVLQYLQHLPAEIPQRPSTAYFELLTRNVVWDALKATRKI